MTNSFLYNKDVFEFIIKSAQETPDPSYSQIKNTKAFDIGIAKKLVNNLYRQLTGAKEPVNITANKEAVLDVSKLRSLADLLKYLSENEIKINGLRIAYNYNESKIIPDQLLSEMLPITIDKMNPENNFYVNKSALQNYLEHIKEEAKNRKDNQLSQLASNIEKSIPALLTPPVPAKDTVISPRDDLAESDKESDKERAQKQPLTPTSLKRKVDTTISHIMSTLPLSMSDIDFGRIDKFFEQLTNLIKFEENMDPRARQRAYSFTTQIGRVDAAIREAQALCHDPSQQVIPLRTELGAISALLKEDSKTQGFLGILYNTVSMIQSIVNLFKNVYQEQLQDLKINVTALDNQVGSIARSNMNQLQSWIGQDKALRARVGA